MSKLYKYLPFDIKVVDEDGEIFKVVAIDKLGQVLCDFDNYDVGGDDERQQEGNWMKLTNPKPLLRSFKDLTKELPLTKAAAEMISMKEGQTVSVIEKFYCILGLEILTDAVYPYTYPIFNTDYDSENTKVRLNKNFTVWIDSINPHFKELFNSEKAFDFLRAMHFAVGLEENEYQEIN